MIGSSKDAWLIVGLGNPGREYERSRHNCGFRAIDRLAGRLGCKIDKAKFQGLYGKTQYGGKPLYLLKPLTYMNLSGESVGEIMNFYKLDPEEELLVIFDDISLAPGNIRIRKKGSAGGHNGIKSIIAHTGTMNFKRIKIGVGEKPKDWDLADYVLGRFDASDRRKVDDAIADAMEAAKRIACDDIDGAMNDFNAKKVDA